MKVLISSINSNMYFPANELLIPPASISQPLYNSYTYFPINNQQPDPSDVLPTIAYKFTVFTNDLVY